MFSPTEERPGRRRSAVEASAGDMQAAPARYVSASELYSTDEVELLLEEIRELEPTSCRGEEVQDFEIAGSGCAGAGAGGRSPAGTDLTERSWDSHAHYSRAPPPRPRALAPVYCRLAYLRTPTGALSLVLLSEPGACIPVLTYLGNNAIVSVLLCSLSICICVWGALGLRAASSAKPLLFGALTSFMLHTLLMLMHVSLLDALLPVDWNRLGGISFAWSAAWLSSGAAALLAALPPHAPHPPHTASMLYTATGLGLAGALAALAAALLALRGGCARRGSRASAPSLAAYRAVPQPTRDHAL